MKTMVLYREMAWWYWAAMLALLATGLSGQRPAFGLALALGVVQIVHFRIREGRFSAFPVQIRLVYSGLLVLAISQRSDWLFVLIAIGTTLLILFGYCLLARCWSLMPWNRREPLSVRLVLRTFASPPVAGSVLQGLPSR